MSVGHAVGVPNQTEPKGQDPAETKWRRETAALRMLH
jgi:hypothetical protein